jgi:VIT1/CCC1 family predicted Fe2+/Mn2+ transporter
MLIGALGCNLSWGIIDAILYLMGCLADKGTARATFRAVRAAGSPAEGRRQLADALPPALSGVLDEDDLEKMRLRLEKAPEPSAPPRLSRDDWRGALGVFLLVVVSTFPVVIPFIVMSGAMPALRVSNAIAIVLLALTGYAFGRITGRRPVWVAVAMVVLGATLVAMTMALGG